MLGPILFSLFIDPLLHELTTLLSRRVSAYADDLKLVAEVMDKVMIQSAINQIQNWS